MRWIKLLVVLALLVVSLNLAAGPASAGGPPDYSDPVVLRSVIDRLAQAGDQTSKLWGELPTEAREAVLKYTRLARVEVKWEADSDDVSILAAGCLSPVLAIYGYNYYGNELWGYFQQIDYCFDGSVITSLGRGRWGEVYIWPWQFQGHIGNEESGGVGQSYYYAMTQGQFGNCPPVPGCVQWSYPWIWMRVYGDGRVTEGDAGY